MTRMLFPLVLGLVLAGMAAAQQNCTLPAELSLLGSYLPALGLDLNSYDTEAADMTVFAPTNDAFNSFFASVGWSNDSSTWNSTQKTIMTGAIFYHVLNQTVTSTGLSAALATSGVEAIAVPTFLARYESKICPSPETDIIATVFDGAVVIVDATGDNATVITGDIIDSCLRSNTNRTTTVHVVDKVLLPCAADLCEIDIGDTLIKLNQTYTEPLFIDKLIPVAAQDFFGTKSVFVPTVAAFSATLENILKYIRQPAAPANFADTKQLLDVYSYHVTITNVTATNDTVRTYYGFKDLLEGFCYSPFVAGNVSVETFELPTPTRRLLNTGYHVITESGQVVSAKPVAQACDGTVYVVDQVLLPCPVAASIIDAFVSCNSTADELKYLARFGGGSDISVVLDTVLLYSDTATLLSNATNITIFAPTNDAIVSTLAVLKIPLDPAQRTLGQNLTLIEVLKYHVVPGYASSADIIAGIRAAGSVTVDTLVNNAFCPNASKTIMAGIDEMGMVYLHTPATHAMVVRTDLSTPCLRQQEGRKSIAVHVIDKVLAPCPDLTKAFTFIAPPSPPALPGTPKLPSPPPARTSTPPPPRNAAAAFSVHGVICLAIAYMAMLLI